MGAPFGDARRHGQHRLLAIQGLDLRLLIHAKHDRPVRRRHVKTDDVLHLVDKERIRGELECLGTMRLQAKRGPDPTDGGMRKAAVGSHRTDGPVRGILRSGVQRTLDDLGNLDIGDSSRSTRTIFICQPFNTILYEPAAPLANRVLVNTQAFGNVLALQTLRAQKDHPASIRQGAWRFMPAHLRFEKKSASLRTTTSACLPTIDQTPALVTEAEQNEAYFGSM